MKKVFVLCVLFLVTTTARAQALTPGDFNVFGPAPVQQAPCNVCKDGCKKCCGACGKKDYNACKCPNCACCKECLGKKKEQPTAYFLAYNQAMKEKRGLLTVRGDGKVKVPEAYWRDVAKKENRVFALVPDDDNRVPVGVQRCDYENGDLYVVPTQRQFLSPPQFDMPLRIQRGGC